MLSEEVIAWLPCFLHLALLTENSQAGDGVEAKGDLLAPHGVSEPTTRITNQSKLRIHRNYHFDILRPDVK